MQILEMVNTGSDVFRNIFRVVDGALYDALSFVTNLLFHITKFTISSGFVQDFISRIYIIISIYMLFKLAFSLLNGIVNPDSLTDKQSGMQKIIPRILISLALLIMIPTVIFPRLIEWQEPIAATIPKIVLGTTSNLDFDLDSDASIGNEIAGTALQAFIYPSTACTAIGGNVEDAPNNLNILDEAIVKQKCSEERHIWAYDYKLGLSTLIGLALLIIVFLYCIDIAIRAIKLCVLQVLAPIPIISYIDPKSEKDGAFAGWLKNGISTYIDLFIKIAIMYFVLFFIKALANWDSYVFSFGTDISDSSKSMVILFLMLGLFFFLIQAPKFIRDILGIKSSNNSLGMAAFLGGTAALIGGAGFAGAGAAMLNGMSEAADSNAQGKQYSGAWRRGSDLAAQIKTGDKNARGGMVGWLSKMGQGHAMQNAAKRSGLTKERVDAAKNNMMHEQQKATDLKAAMELAHAEYIHTPQTAPFAPKVDDPGEWKGKLPPKRSDYSTADDYTNAVSSFNSSLDGVVYKEWETKHQAYQNYQNYINSDAYKAREKYMAAQVAYAQQEQIAAAAQRNFEKGKKNYEARTLPKPDFTPKQKFDPNKKS